MNNEDNGIWVFILMFVAAWFINLFKLFACDFDSPYKDEVIHFIGLFVPPASIITAWF
jgi:hypothetical protein